MKIFSFSPPISLCKEGKWFLAVTSFGATNSVSNIFDENKSFSIAKPGYHLVLGEFPTICPMELLIN